MTLNISDNDECVIVYGVYSTSETPNPPYNEDTELYYNFIAYKNIIEISEDIPMTSNVKEGEFKYFIYHY